jgi:hypothetical protein
MLYFGVSGKGKENIIGGYRVSVRSRPLGLEDFGGGLTN